MDDPPDLAEDVPASAWAIHARGVRKRFRGGALALDGLDLSIPRGGVHGLLGPNGSGKSTTMRVLLGLIRPDAGEASLLGAPLPDGLPRVIDRVGAIIEEPRFFPSMTAATNLTLLARAIGAPRSRVADALQQVGLAQQSRTLARGLSLGMRQRLAIATTLLKDPDLFIFDEPTNGLDPAGIHAVRATIQDLATRGRTVVVSSHNLAEVQQIADTVSIIASGRLVWEGPVSSLVTAGAGGVRVRLGESWGPGRPLDVGVTALRAEGYEVAIEGEALHVTRGDAKVDGASVARTLGRVDVWPSELVQDGATLEDAFLALTDGAGRDMPHQGGAA